MTSTRADAGGRHRGPCAGAASSQRGSRHAAREVQDVACGSGTWHSASAERRRCRRKRGGRRARAGPRGRPTPSARDQLAHVDGNAAPARRGTADRSMPMRMQEVSLVDERGPCRTRRVPTRGTLAVHEGEGRPGLLEGQALGASPRRAPRDCVPAPVSYVVRHLHRVAATRAASRAYDAKSVLAVP